MNTVDERGDAFLAGAFAVCAEVVHAEHNEYLLCRTQGNPVLDGNLLALVCRVQAVCRDRGKRIGVPHRPTAKKLCRAQTRFAFVSAGCGIVFQP